jgi:hypothetical protein
MKTGTRVVRIDGGKGYVGAKGVVIGVNDKAGRVQIQWDTVTRLGYSAWQGDARQDVVVKGKKTWIKISSVSAE